MVRGRPARSIGSAGRGRSPRQVVFGPDHVLAERVQPAARPIPADELRGRTGCQRVPVPAAVLDRRARRAYVLSEGFMKKIIALLALLPMLTAPVHAQGKLSIVTTTEDLAAVAREIAGDRAAVESIARGYQDPHFVEAKPSFILRLQRADLLIVVGRELEIGWLPPLVNQSRNAKVQP